MTFAGKAKTELGQLQFMRLRLFRQLLAKLIEIFTVPLGRRLERLALAVGRRCEGRAFALESPLSVSRSRSNAARSSARAC